MRHLKGLLLLFPFLLFSEIQFDGSVDKDEWQNAVRYSIDVETRPIITPAEHKPMPMLCMMNFFFMLVLKFMAIRNLSELRLDHVMVFSHQ